MFKLLCFIISIFPCLSFRHDWRIKRLADQSLQSAIHRSKSQLNTNVKALDSPENVFKYRRNVYEFNEGSAKDKMLLGNKGANLCEMTRYYYIYDK